MSEHPYGQSGMGGQQPTGPQPMSQGDPNAFQQYQQQPPQQQFQQQQYQPAVPVTPAAPLFSHPWISKLVMIFGIVAGVGLLMMLAYLGHGEFMVFLSSAGGELFQKGLLGLVLTLVLQGVWIMIERTNEAKSK